MTTTRIRRRLNASVARVYRALTDPDEIAMWRFPRGMTCRVHEFDAREDGVFRVSLTYVDPSPVGKTSAHTDTYHGRFIRLAPNEQVVESITFETDDPSLGGEMIVTTTLVASGSGTELQAVHEGVPAAVDPTANETGWREALDRLAELVEAQPKGGRQ